MVSAMFRNEMLKMRHRLAFWVTLAFFSFVVVVAFGEDYYRAAAQPDDQITFAFPDAWSLIVSQMGQAAVVFASVVLILLISSEFAWRTARQQVIDGLSKDQFFGAKLMLLPAVTLIFMLVQVGTGATLALLGTDQAAAAGPLMRGAHWSAIAGLFLALVGHGSLALLIGTAVRSAGPAMGVFLLYSALGEDLITGGLQRLGRLFGNEPFMETVVGFAPIAVFNRMLSYVQHDAVAFEAALERAAEQGRTPPEVWSLGTAYVSALAWIALLVGIAFFWFRKRDL